MAVHFTRGAHDFSLDTRHRLHPDPQPAPVVTKRHGHAVTRKYKVVCKRCNERWMSGIENAAKPFIEPMLLGEPVTLGSESQVLVLRWIVLKLMVFERQEDTKPVFTREEALRFAADRSIPKNLAVDLFYTTDDRLRSGIHRESAAIPPEIDPVPDVVATNLQAVTFLVGRLAIYGRHAQLRELGFKKISPNISIRLWPDAAETVTWPPAQALSPDDVEYLNGTMGRFLADKTPV